MSKMQTANQPALSRRAIRTRILFTLIYAVLVPYLIYRVGNERYHLSAVNALLLAALSPAVGSLIEFVRKRQLSVLGLFALVGIAAKVARRRASTASRWSASQQTCRALAKS